MELIRTEPPPTNAGMKLGIVRLRPHRSSATESSRGSESRLRCGRRSLCVTAHLYVSTVTVYVECVASYRSVGGLV